MFSPSPHQMGTTVRVAIYEIGAPNLWRAWEAIGLGRGEEMLNQQLPSCLCPFPGAQSPSIMAKGNNQKMANGSTPEFEAQLWAAAERAEPAFNYKRRERWPCASTPRNTGSFRADLQPDLKADFILANLAVAGYNLKFIC